MVMPQACMSLGQGAPARLCERLQPASAGLTGSTTTTTRSRLLSWTPCTLPFPRNSEDNNNKVETGRIHPEAWTTEPRPAPGPTRTLHTPLGAGTSSVPGSPARRPRTPATPARPGAAGRPVPTGRPPAGALAQSALPAAPPAGAGPPGSPSADGQRGSRRGGSLWSAVRQRRLGRQSVTSPGIPPLLPCPPLPGRGLPAAKPPGPAEPAPLRGLGPRHDRRPSLGFALLLRPAPAGIPPRG